MKTLLRSIPTPLTSSFLLFLLIVLLLSCGKSPAERYGTPAILQQVSPIPVKVVAPTIIQPSTGLNINLYIENSGSMNGYVNGSTEFKELLVELIVDLRHIFNEAAVNVLFINEIQRPLDTIQFNLSHFANSLSPAQAPYRVSGIDRPLNTYFDEILNSILRQTDQNTISLLVSDCIYSPRSPLGDPIEFARARILDVYWGILQNDPDVIAAVYKMNSEFNGNYYPESPGCTPFWYHGQRPYYLWVIGGSSKVANLIDRVEPDIKSVSGYEDKHTFYASSPFSSRFWSFLTLTGTNDQLQPDKNLSGMDYIRGIEGFKTRDRLEFVIVADLSGNILENSYITNTENYDIVSGKYILEKAGKIDPSTQKINFGDDQLPIAPSDWFRIKNTGATHAFLFKAESPAPGNLKFALKKQLPRWVKDSNIRNDSHADSIIGKTFNLQPLIDGVSDAYLRIDSTPYITLDIPVLPESGPNPGRIILTLFIIALVVAVPVFIIINRKQN